MKILITLGATAEPIDGVRFITNFSSGATGSFLADALTRKEHKVLALCAKTAKCLPNLCEKDFFTDFSSLDNMLKKTLKKENFDLLIHLAAVSDFSPALIICGGKKMRPQDVKKLPSDKDLRIELKRNFKIVERIKTYAANSPVLVAFKLTNGAKGKAIMEAVSKVKGADLVVHNDLEQISSKTRRFCIYKDGIKRKVCSLAKLPDTILSSAFELRPS